MEQLTTETPFVHQIEIGDPPQPIPAQFPQYSGVTELTDQTTLTLTTEQIMGGIIVHNPDGTATDVTLPTAALIIAAMTGVPKNKQSFMFSIINTSGTAATDTVAAGTGGSIVGLATITYGTSGLFLCKVASDTTVVFYRLK